MSEEKQPLLVVVVGAPGSGKSTWGKKFAQEKGINYISSDELRAQLGTGEDDQTVTPQVFGIVKRKVEDWLSRGQSVLVDATNINKKDRKMYVDAANRHGAYKLAVVFEVSKEELLKRNKARGDAGGRNVPEWVIDKMLTKYQRPDTVEFDKVVMK
jgi:predicted kinase